jgi:hypothetical protein
MGIRALAASPQPQVPSSAPPQLDMRSIATRGLRTHSAATTDSDATTDAPISARTPFISEMLPKMGSRGLRFWIPTVPISRSIWTSSRQTHLLKQIGCNRHWNHTRATS